MSAVIFKEGPTENSKNKQVVTPYNTIHTCMGLHSTFPLIRACCFMLLDVSRLTCDEYERINAIEKPLLTVSTTQEQKQIAQRYLKWVSLNDRFGTVRSNAGGDRCVA